MKTQIGRVGMIRLGDAKIKAYWRNTAHGTRAVVEYTIDTPTFSYCSNFCPPESDRNEQAEDGLDYFLTLLQSAAEAKRHKKRTTQCAEQKEIFPTAVVNWATQHLDELDALRDESVNTDDE
jgi:hypothetical protein